MISDWRLWRKFASAFLISVLQLVMDRSLRLDEVSYKWKYKCTYIVITLNMHGVWLYTIWVQIIINKSLWQAVSKIGKCLIPPISIHDHNVHKFEFCITHIFCISHNIVARRNHIHVPDKEVHRPSAGSNTDHCWFSPLLEACLSLPTRPALGS